MNERLKKIRKTLGLSGEKFGEKLGVKKGAISSLENGRTNLTNQFILAVCREYNVNEEWIRYGKGDMFIDNMDAHILALAKHYNLSKLEVTFLIEFITASSEKRKMLQEFASFVYNICKLNIEEVEV